MVYVKYFNQNPRCTKHGEPNYSKGVHDKKLTVISIAHKHNSSWMDKTWGRQAFYQRENRKWTNLYDACSNKRSCRYSNKGTRL